MMNNTDIDQNAGKTLVSINVSSSCFPTLEAILPKGTDCNLIAIDLQRLINREVEAYFEFRTDIMKWDGVKVEVNPRSGKIKTKKAREQSMEKCRAELSEALKEGAAALQQKLKKNPNNGKYGYWQINGIRHNEIVTASSAEEAVKKSMTVGAWELIGCSYIGKEIPENFSM